MGHCMRSQCAKALVNLNVNVPLHARQEIDDALENITTYYIFDLKLSNTGNIILLVYRRWSVEPDLKKITLATEYTQFEKQIRFLIDYCNLKLFITHHLEYRFRQGLTI
jgi:hypothetical protein